MTAIIDIEGIGETYATKLKDAGVATVEALLTAGNTPKAREALAEHTGIAGKLILKWVNHADLFRIHGVAGQFAELLEAAGVDTVAELARRNAQNLQEALAATNEEKKIAGSTPSLSQVE
ncbi:MAG: DUF4332 domain-containing protein, partial [Deefgea sp.]